MPNTKCVYATVDAEGRLVLPPDVAGRHGLQPGDRLPLTEGANSIRLRQPVSRLTRVYIEPTSRCNLMCTTCIRNAWDEQPGQMAPETFAAIAEGIKSFSPAPEVFFGGLGEPLSHPDIISMVSEIKKSAPRVELITNGTLLTDSMSRRLIDAGLDVLWVSLDGARPESYADVRLGATLPEVIENLSAFRDMRENQMPAIGIVFVAMKKNIAELPEVIQLGRQLGADRFMITNVLPYTEEMSSQMLYEDILSTGNLPSPSTLAPLIYMSRTDTGVLSFANLPRALRGAKVLSFSNNDAGPPGNYCPFIEKGSTAIAWDGSVCPCLPLMHNHVSILNDRRRKSRRCVLGVITEKTLKDIWASPDYVALRERVQVFDFSPCAVCGGCRLSQANEEDCLGNEFPACGGCLWAQGVIQCP